MTLLPSNMSPLSTNELQQVPLRSPSPKQSQRMWHVKKPLLRRRTNRLLKLTPKLLVSWQLVSFLHAELLSEETHKRPHQMCHPRKNTAVCMKMFRMISPPHLLPNVSARICNFHNCHLTTYNSCLFEVAVRWKIQESGREKAGCPSGKEADCTRWRNR